MYLLVKFDAGTVGLQQRFLKAGENNSFQLTEEMTVLRTEINNLKDIILHGVEDDNNKQFLVYIEDVLSNNFPCFKKAFNKGTFSSVMFS